MALFSEKIQILIDATTKGAVSELNKLEKQSKGTATQMDKMSATIKGSLVPAAAALVGTGLVAFLGQSVEAFADAAKSASDLANASGGSVEEVSRMQAALEDAGISAEQSAGLLTKFTTGLSTEKGVKALQALNVELVKNADGTTNYAATMVDAVDAITQIGDASKRNKAFVDLFGKAGAKAFQDLANSGIKLSDAMESIQKHRVFNEGDVRKAMAYDDAMDSLAGSAKGLQFALGETLIPMLTLVADAFSMVLDAIGLVPPEFLLVGGAAVALNMVLKTELVVGAASAIGTFVATTITSFAILITGTTTVSGAFKAMQAAITASMATNPIGWILLAFAAAAAGIMALNNQVNDSIDEGVAKYQDLKKAGVEAGDALTQAAKEQEANQNVLQGMWAAWRDQPLWESAIKGLAGWLNVFPLAKDALTEGGADLDYYKKKIQEVADEQGEMAALTEGAAAQQTALNDAVAGFLAPELSDHVVTLQEIADAARDAADAELEQKRASELADIAMGAYGDSVQRTLGFLERLTGLTGGYDAALNKAQEAYAKLKGLTDDPLTIGNEWNIQMGEVQQSIVDAARELEASGLTGDEIVTQLRVDFKDAPQEVQDFIDTVLAPYLTGDKNEIPVPLKPFLDPTGLQPDDLPEEFPGQNVPLTVVPQGIPEAQSTIDGVAGEKPIPMPLTPEGESEVEASKSLAATPVDIAVSYVVGDGSLDVVNTYNDSLRGNNINIPVTYTVVGGSLDAINGYNDSLSGKKLTVNVAYKTTGTAAIGMNLAAMSKPRTVEFKPLVVGAGKVEKELDALDKDRKVNYHVGVVGAGAVGAILASLDRDRWVTVHVNYQRMNAVPPGMTRSTYSAGPSAPSAASAGTTVINQTNNISVPGSGDPGVTAREIDRYIRRAGDRALSSVTAP